MSHSLIEFIMSAGVAAVAYSQFGKRIGYSNSKQLWIIVGITFLASWIFLFITLTFVIHFK